MKTGKRKGLFVIIVLLMMFISGCNYNYKQLFTSQKQEEKLTRVEIAFDESDKIVGYVKSLGIEDNAKVYIGGASLNYVYDSNGNVIGSFNYSKVMYIKILPEEQR